MNSLRAFLICIAIVVIVFPFEYWMGRNVSQALSEYYRLLIGAAWGLFVRELWMWMR